MSDHETPQVPEVIERFVKALVVANKAVQLYPPASNIPRDTAQDAVVVLREALRERPEVRLVVTKSALFFESDPIFQGHSAYEAFASELYNRKLADVRFHAGVEPLDLVAFLAILKYTPEQLEAAGGYESRLWDQGVTTITVTEAHVSIVDTIVGDTAEDPDSLVFSRETVDQLIASSYGGRPRDHIMMARFIGHPPAVARYLRETFHAGEDACDLMGTAERFAELSEIAYDMGGEEGRAGMLRSLGEALDALDPALRRELLVEELLTEARTNEPLAAVIRQLDVDSVCRMLVEDLDAAGVSRDGLARAIRNLALISLADREEVVSAAGAAMMGSGLPESVAASVLDMAAPSRLTVRERPMQGGRQEQPADAIFKLMDIAPVPERAVPGEGDPEVAALQEEARRGITDGDVIMALVTLVGIETRDTQFATSMALLEDSLDLLVGRGEIEIAADAADALIAASRNEALADEQRNRLRKAIGRFSRAEDVKATARTLRLHKPGSSEYEAARRLLDALGDLSIAPLMEYLAEESDMAARKGLVDLLSEMAPRYPVQFGDYVNDSRWYVVRNVVSILGSTRSSAVLSYLQRTVRHSESRVRRETIRALSGISDRLAEEMLISALNDDDGQNVQLAARYLGAAKAKGAAGALERVARGDGRTKEPSARIEAIEALGRLGTPEVVPTLEAIAGKRSIMSARSRELRTAAIAALERLSRGGGEAE